MNGFDFLKTLNGLEPALILEQPKKPVRRPFYKSPSLYAFLAAVIIIAAAIAVPVIKSASKPYKLQQLTYDEGSVFTVEFSPVSFDEFTGEIREAGKQIRKRFENHNPFSSTYPNSYSSSFSSQQELLEYLGYSGLSELHFPFYTANALVSAEAGYPVYFYSTTDECAVYMVNVHIFSRYEKLRDETGFIYADERILMLTDELDEQKADSLFALGLPFPSEIESHPFVYRVRLNDYDDNLIEQTFRLYKNKSGNECRLAFSVLDDEPYDRVKGYMVHNGMLFELSLTYYKNDEQKAVKAMCDWADSFK